MPTQSGALAFRIERLHSTSFFEDSAVSNLPNDQTPIPASNFIRNIIDSDLAACKHTQRRWSGKPGLADQQLAGPLDPADRRALGWELHEAGWSNKRIARELGVHPSTVGRWFTPAHLTTDSTESADEREETTP